MIKKYVFGTPFPTNAVVTEMETAKDKLPFLETDNQGTFTYALSENDIVYGLGEQIRGINKRGWQYVSWNYDNPNHHEDTRSLYGSHNFILIRGDVTFGAFFDYAGKMEFDIGYTRRDLMQIKAAKNDLFISSLVKMKRTLSSSSVKSLAEAISPRSGRSVTVRAVGVIRPSRTFARSQSSTRLPVFRWTAFIWTLTIWNATRILPWTLSVFRI